MICFLLISLALKTAQSRDSSFFLISDIHYDLAYEPSYNSSALCHCVGVLGRNREIIAALDEKPLGRFECDSPLALLSSALWEMRKVDPEPDFVLVTGDLIGHYTYYLLQANGKYNSTYSAAMVRRSFVQITDEFKAYFPTTQILFALGNNDGYGDYQLPTSPGAQSLNEFLYDLWRPLNKNLPEGFMETGYYASNIDATGQRLLVLSTNYFSVSVNIVDDPAISQLKWLRSELLSAHHTHTRVIIAMHIPPGPGMYNANSYDWHSKFISLFEKLIQAYRSNIDFIFAAHQHQSGFQIIPNSGLAVVVHPALSPIFSNNPGFRYYQLRGERQDYTDYFLDLFSKTPEWAEEIVFSQFTGLDRFDYEELYKKFVMSPRLLFDYLVISHGLQRDLGTFIDEAFIWRQTLGLFDGHFMERVALCTFRYFSNDMFDMCKMGLLPID